MSFLNKDERGANRKVIFVLFDKCNTYGGAWAGEISNFWRSLHWNKNPPEVWQKEPAVWQRRQMILKPAADVWQLTPEYAQQYYLKFT